MNYRIGRYLSIIIAVCFTMSCSTDDYQDRSNLYFNSLPTRVADFTRDNISASSQTLNTFYFQRNDQMRLFFYDTNGRNTDEVNVSFKDNHWEISPSVSLSLQKSSQTSGIYPSPAEWQLINKDGQRIYDYSLPLDQSEKEFYKSSDLLYTLIENRRESLYKASFKHLLSSVVVVLKSNTFSEEELESAKVNIYSISKGEINMYNGAVQESYNVNDIEAVAACKFSDNTYRAIVMPQSLGNMSKGRDHPWVTVKIGERSFHYFAPLYFEENYISDIKAGHQLTINLNLEKENLTGFVSTTKWVYGVTPPTQSDWTKGDQFMDEYPCLTWKKGRQLGIYDAKKSNPYGELGKEEDVFQCWVASVANIIDWWLYNNKENIDRYGYRGPYGITGPTDSSVFKEMSSRLPNKGSNPFFCISAFFMGQIDKNGKPYGGYFKELMKNERPYEEITFPDNPTTFNRFNKAMRDAFRHNRAIQWCTIEHAMTIWGADFNENGEVTALYFVDNNDLFTARGFVMGLKKTAVFRKGNEVWVSHAEDRFPKKITSILTLDLMKEGWDKYFSERNQ